MSSRESTVRPKRFEHLPFGVFRHCTNIYGLVNEKLSQKYHKCPPNFVIKKTIEKYYEKLQNADKWDDEIIEQLEYKCGPGVEMIDGAIWSLSKREQNRIFKEATDYQKQFLILPFHVFSEATNVRSLVGDDSAKHHSTLDDFVKLAHEKLPKIRTWLPSLDNLKFLDDSELELIFEQSTVTPGKRVLRKRKGSCLDEMDSQDASNSSSLTAKRSKQTTTDTKNVTHEFKLEKNHSNLALKSSKIPMLEKRPVSKIISFVRTDIQQDVENFNFIEFITKTNIKEIIRNELCNLIGNQNAITDEDMSTRLQFYYRIRKDTRQWYETGLKNLTIVDIGTDINDNGRSTEPKSTKTNTVQTIDAETQYYPTDFQLDAINQTNESQEPNKTDLRVKVDSLTIHEIIDAEIIHIEHFHDTPTACDDSILENNLESMPTQPMNLTKDRNENVLPQSSSQMVTVSENVDELSLESGTSSENSERKTEFLLSSASSALSINDLIALFERSNDKQYAVYIQKKSNKEAEPCETPNEHIAQKSQSAHSIEVKSNEHNLSGQDDKTTEMQRRSMDGFNPERNSTFKNGNENTSENTDVIDKAKLVTSLEATQISQIEPQLIDSVNDSLSQQKQTSADNDNYYGNENEPPNSQTQSVEHSNPKIDSNQARAFSRAMLAKHPQIKMNPIVFNSLAEIYAMFITHASKHNNLIKK